MGKKIIAEYVYFSSIDWLRVFAALGVVWFHNIEAKYRAIGYAGLPVFLLVFCALIVIHNKDHQCLYYFRKNGQRLLIPWVFWSIIFIIFKLVKCHLNHTAFNLSSLNIAIGGNIHLWYLPFAFVASMFLHWFCNKILRNKQQTNLLAVVLLIIIIITVICSFMNANMSFKPPYAQWIFALPSVPLGFAIGYIVRFNKKENKLVQLFILYWIFLVTCFISYQIWKNSILVPYGIGAAFTIIAFCITLKTSKFSQQLGLLTYGIYLIHPIVMSLVNHFFHQIALLPITLITFIISAVIVYLFRLTKMKVVL